MRTRAELDAALAELNRRHDDILKETAAVFAAAGVPVGDGRDALELLHRADPGRAEAVERYRAGLGKALGEIAAVRGEIHDLEERELEARRARLSALARVPGNVEGPWEARHPDTDRARGRQERRTVTVQHPLLSGGRDAAMSAALRAVDALPLGPGAQDRLDAVIRDDRHDPAGVGAAYLAAVADPLYLAAFGRIVAGAGPFDLDPDEHAAVRAVRQAQSMAAALGYSTTGGYGVPASLDPTIMVTGEGGASALRDVARVVTIAVDKWEGVSSDGVEAVYAAEFTEASDGTPTLAQPTIETEWAQAWIEYGIALGQDWGGLQQELGRLLAQGRSDVEAEKFANGAGHASHEPAGIYSSVPGGSITGATLDLAGVYAVQAALPARYSPNARWLLSVPTLNEAGRLVGSGDPDEPQILSADGSQLLRKPWSEVSTIATGGLLYGDIRQAFTIVDRIGMAVELVPHVMGENRRPTGKRGLFAFWRNSSAIVNADAVRAISTGS